MKLSKDDIRALCDAVNAYGEGTGPVADENSLWHFSILHVRACLLRAMAESAEACTDDVWTRGIEDVGGVHLSWDRAREVEAALYTHRLGEGIYMSDLRGQDLQVGLELEFSTRIRRVIKASFQTAEEGRYENPVLASEVEPATREELQSFVDEVVDQKLDWLAEDHDDLPPEED